MVSRNKGGFYAVRIGRKPGVYTSWPEAQAQVSGMPGCVHKKFPTLSEAQEFVNGGTSAARAARQAASGPSYDSSSSSSKKRGRVDEQQLKTTGTGSKRVKSIRLTGTGRQENVRRVYCDGSSRGNGQAGAVAGIGVFWGDDSKLPNLSERLPGAPQTNNRAEMFAVARILETDPHPELPLTICSDSQYTISVFSHWIPAWRQSKWKTSEGKDVQNQDLIRYVVSLISLRMPPNATESEKAEQPLANVSFQKVKAHVGIRGNEMADQLANEGAMKPLAPERNFAADTQKNEELLEKRGLNKVKVLYEVLVDDLPTEEEMREMEDSQEFD